MMGGGVPWNFGGQLLVQVIGAFAGALVGGLIALVVAFRTTARKIDQARRDELRGIAYSLSVDVAQYRNSKDITDLRRALRRDLGKLVDGESPAKQKQITAEWLEQNSADVTEKKLGLFLGRMNTFAWQVQLLSPNFGAISRCADGSREPDRDNVIELFYENLLKEWAVLEAWSADSRPNDWSLIHLRELVAYARQRESVISADVQLRADQLAGKKGI